MLRLNGVATCDRLSTQSLFSFDEIPEIHIQDIAAHLEGGSLVDDTLRRHGHHVEDLRILYDS